MAKHRTIIYKSPPPPAKPPSAPPPPAAVNLLDSALKLVGVAVLVVGAITLAAPWLHQVERPAPVPAGWICWDVTRSTSTDSERSKHCSPQFGWRAVRLPDGGAVAVPDNADFDRRHYVRD
jgi:hypothetical protein